MNLKDIKEQLKEGMQRSSQRLQESHLYARAKERYDVMPPASQRLVGAAAVLFLAFIVLLIPLSLFFSAQDAMIDFVENKTLARTIILTQRELQQGPQPQPPLSTDQISSKIEGLLKSARLIPDQIKSSGSGSALLRNWLPRGIDNQGYLLSLSQLNLQQIVDIGYSLQNIHPGVKLVNVDVRVNPKNDHYFDVDYALTALGIKPEVRPPPEEEGKGKPTRKKKIVSRKDDA